MEIRSTFNTLFFIKKHRKNSEGLAPIYLRVTINRKSIDLSIHRSVKVNQWDNESNSVIGSTKEVRLINKHLFSVKATVYEHYRNLRETGAEMSAKAVRDSFLGLKGDSKGLIQLFSEHNNEIAKREGIDITSGTIKRYKTSLSRLKEYIKIKYDKEEFALEDITQSFATSYEVYLKTTVNLGHNTYIKHLKHLKKIIKIGIANGLIKIDPFMGIKLAEKKSDRGFISDEDLKILIEKEFDVQRLEEVRDAFIFSCFTGLAYADLSRLTKDNIVTGTDGNRWIKINRKKTDNLSSIPILGVTQKIIEKYSNHPYCIIKGTLLPIKTNQKMNAYLKEISKICNIKKELTTHLARHTFATTVTLNNDVPIETVSKMLGHTSLKTTKIYARLLDKKVGNDMSKLNSIYAL